MTRRVCPADQGESTFEQAPGYDRRRPDLPEATVRTDEDFRMGWRARKDGWIEDANNVHDVDPTRAQLLSETKVAEVADLLLGYIHSRRASMSIPIGTYGFGFHPDLGRRATTA